MDIWLKMFWVGVGGFLGANARFLLGAWIDRRMGEQFPWGTLAINVTGSFLIGVIVVLISERYIVSQYWRFLVAIGFIGAYTTFSTLAYETLVLAEDGSWVRALANVVLNVLAGFLAIVIGVKLARAW